MHNHERIACGPVAELPQKFVEDIGIALHERLGFGGEQVNEQPRPLEKNRLIRRRQLASSSSQLTEFLVPTICSNEIRALYSLLGNAFNDGLHG